MHTFKNHASPSRWYTQIKEKKDNENEENEKSCIALSITFYSTIKFIFTSLTTAKALIQSVQEILKESYHQPTKQIVKDIALEVKNIRHYH